MATQPRVKTEQLLKRSWSIELTDHVISTAWIASGDKIAAAVVSGPIVIADAVTGRILHTLHGHGFGTTAVGWQPGTDVLASTGQDGKAKLWNTTTGECSRELVGGAAWVELLAWHPAGKLFATAAGKSVRVWTADGDMVREFKEHPASVLDLAWKPGTSLLGAATYGGIFVYDPTLDEPVRKYDWKGSPLVLVWSPDGRLLAHGNQDSTVHFWFADADTPLQMHGFPTKVRELSFDSTSRYLATGGGAAACVWDCGGPGPEGRKPQMLMDEVGESEASLTACRWQHRGFRIAGTFADGAVRVWQPAAKGKLIGEDTFTDGEAVHPSWSPDDRRLLVGSGGGTLAMFKVG